MNERAVLSALVAAFVAVGLVLAAVPFVAGMRAPEPGNETGPYVELSVSNIAPGEFRVVEIGGRPVAVVRPDAAMLSGLHGSTARTWSGMEPIPSTTGVFAFSLISTYGRCAVQHEPKGTSRYPAAVSWPGGFYDPCNVGEWDYAGRALKLGPASVQLKDLERASVELLAPDTLRIYGSPG
jgi:Rieske Fe-S protein